MARDTTILLIEDDPLVANLIRDVLEANGYRVWWVGGGAAGKAMLDQVQPNLVILDLMLPDADGLVLCAELRERRADVPIVVCSATPLKRDAILALKLGADDFIPKPFAVEELRARVEAVLRRASQPIPQPPRVTRLGALAIDHGRHRVHVGTREIALTHAEYRLLAGLLSRPNEVLSRQDLAQVMWGSEEASIGRAIDVYVYRLRTKLREAEAETGLSAPPVVTVRGAGFKAEQRAA